MRFNRNSELHREPFGIRCLGSLRARGRCVRHDSLERRRGASRPAPIAAAAVRPGGCRCSPVNYHVLPEPHGCGWIVTSGCGAEVAAICDSREDALVVARIRKVLDRVKNLQRAFTPVGLATSGCFALPAGLAAGIEAADRADAARPRSARPRRNASQRSLPRGPRAR
jgi:hypothetical protein